MQLLLYCCLLAFMALSQTPSHVKGHSISDVRNLSETLFVTKSYDKRYRPVFNQSEPVVVSIDFILLTLNALDTSHEIMRVTGYLQVEWMDEFLQWNPGDYGDIQDFNLPQDDVWKPVVALRNSHIDYAPLGDPSMDVNCDNGGVITWIAFKVYTSTCSMKVYYYPFDVQTCQLKFAALGYGPAAIDLTVVDGGIVLDEYETNPQWDILETQYEIVSGNNDVSVVLTLKLRRIPTYVIFTVLVPILLLTVLNIFVFLLPCESGERVGYAITVFLSFAVFFSTTTSVLPETVALISIYVVTMTTQSVLICIIAIVQVRLSHKNATEHLVPKWLTNLSIVGYCRKRQVNGNNRINHIDTPDVTLQELDAVSIKQEVTLQDGNGEVEDVSWKTVMSDIDYILMIMFIVISVVIISTCIGMCANSK